MSKLPNAGDFSSEIEKIKIEKKLEGADFVDIVSGELHRRLGLYPSNNHRLPVCCQVMYAMMKSSDDVLSAPPKGKGATLKIRYYL